MHQFLCFIVLCLCTSITTCLKFHTSVVDIKDKAQWVQEIQLNPEPALVLFYASSCGVCHRFVKTHFNTLAQHYEQWSVWNDQALRVATVNCHLRESMKICYQEGNPAYPKMFLYNMNATVMPEGKGGTQDAHVPSYESVSVLMDTISTKTEHFWGKSTYLVAIEPPVSTPPPSTPTPVVDIARDPRERLIAVAAVIVHTFDQVFQTVEPNDVLESERFEALVEFITTCSIGFPGKLNRALFELLLVQLEPYHTASRSLTLGRWQDIVEEWKVLTEERYTVVSTQQQYQVGNVETGELRALPTNVFNRDGSLYLSNLPVTGTAPIWWLLHILTINPLETLDREAYPDYFARLYTTLRHYVKYFLACPICQTNFLAENPEAYVETLVKAPDQRQALLLWLWRMHNSVSTRLGLPTWLSEGVVSNNRMEEILTDFYGYMDMELEDSQDDSHVSQQIDAPKEDSQAKETSACTRVVAHPMMILTITFVWLRSVLDLVP